MKFSDFLKESNENEYLNALHTCYINAKKYSNESVTIDIRFEFYIDSFEDDYPEDAERWYNTILKLSPTFGLYVKSYKKLEIGESDIKVDSFVISKDDAETILSDFKNHIDVEVSPHSDIK